MKVIEVRCAGCGVLFEKKGTEVRRSEKLGRKHYCSLSCSGANTPLGNGTLKVARNEKGLRPDNRRDEFSPFRTHLSRIQQRKREVTVTLDDLKRIWDEQEGTCPLTGWKLYLPETSRWTGARCRPGWASLDRIDSSIGYTPENVRWISVMANLAKSSWDDEDVIAFAKAIVDHLPS